MPAEIEIIDRFGRRRRARRGEVPADGETIHFPVQFMDADARAARQALAARFGHPSLTAGDDTKIGAFRRGFVFDANAPLRDAAEEAYETQRQRLHYANKYRQQDHAPPIMRDAAHARALADAAYEDRKSRLQNQWRTR